MVLAPTSSGSKQGKSVSGSTTTLDDLASQLGSEAEGIRNNEGEAAGYGIYYDDTAYDYMQHLRDPGTLGSGVVFMEAEQKKPKSKTKGQSLEDALRQMDLEQKSEELFDQEILPSKNLQRLNYQTQQDVPDAIAGFQPDMDPRLREVLEALEDDAYVDNEDQDIFQCLSKDAKELSTHNFENNSAYNDIWEDEEDGWESDATERPSANSKTVAQENISLLLKEEENNEVPELVRITKSREATAADQNPDWMEDFRKFKKGESMGSHATAQTQRQRLSKNNEDNYDGMSSIITSSTALTGMKRKKRKGALTNPSNYSLTSSVLPRTEQQRLLDSKFEATKARWNAGIDERASGITGISSVSAAPREDFNAIVDEFLEEFGGPRGSGKKGGIKSSASIKDRGVAELDELRKELGPARLPRKGGSRLK